MRIVVLDGYTTNPGDLSWNEINELGQLIVYERTSVQEIVKRAKDADIVVINTVKLTADVLKQLPNLKLISIMAIGYNNVDMQAAKEQGIAVCNSANYSTEAVAQHTIALLLEITNHVALHNEFVQQGAWHKCLDDCFYMKHLILLAGKTMGIIGYGNIGKRVGKIAEALGMKIIPYSKRPGEAIKADVLSLHCPLTLENRLFINSEFISKMKDGAILLNTSRGGLVDELALLEALKSGKIAAAGIDVLETEPPKVGENSPLIGAPNCFITPHHAWMPLETRQLLLTIVYQNIQSFIKGDLLNRVDL